MPPVTDNFTGIRLTDSRITSSEDTA